MKLTGLCAAAPRVAKRGRCTEEYEAALAEEYKPLLAHEDNHEERMKIIRSWNLASMRG